MGAVCRPARRRSRRPLRDLPDQVQPDAHPVCVPGVWGAVKPLEYLPLIRLRHPGARVGHVNPPVQFVGGDPDRYGTSRRRVLHGVVQQVAHRFLRPSGVKHRQDLRGLHCQGHPLLRRLGAELGGGGFQHGSQQQGPGILDDDPCLQPGGLHQGLHQILEFFRLAGKGGGQGPALLRQLLFLQKLGVQPEVGNGGFRLVGDIRHQGFDRVLLPLQIPGGNRRGGQIRRQPALHGREEALVKILLPEVPPGGLLQHPRQAAEHTPGPEPVPQDHQERRSGGQDWHRAHRSTTQV